MPFIVHYDIGEGELYCREITGEQQVALAAFSEEHAPRGFPAYEFYETRDEWPVCRHPMWNRP